MLGMQHKADQWLSQPQPNLTEETVKVALTGHSFKKDDAEGTVQQLDILQESCLFGKFKTRLLTFNKNVADKE